MTEIPTTSNVEMLRELQELLNTHVRPIAQRELKTMPNEHAVSFGIAKNKLIPASLIVDILLYFTKYLSDTAADDVVEARDSGDVGKLLHACNSLEPYWTVARALSLSLRVFAQDPSHGSEHIEEIIDEYTCYVCGWESPSPLSPHDRKQCNGGCPMCEETIEAVFNK